MINKNKGGFVDPTERKGRGSNARADASPCARLRSPAVAVLHRRSIHLGEELAPVSFALRLKIDGRQERLAMRLARRPQLISHTGRELRFIARWGYLPRPWRARTPSIERDGQAGSRDQDSHAREAGRGDMAMPSGLGCLKGGGRERAPLPEHDGEAARERRGGENRGALVLASHRSRVAPFRKAGHDKRARQQMDHARELRLDDVSMPASLSSRLQPISSDAPLPQRNRGLGE